MFCLDYIMHHFCSAGFCFPTRYAPEKSIRRPDKEKREPRRQIHPPPQRSHFMQGLRHAYPGEQVQAARKRVLDELFWELTYWKTPDLYEELTEGERLHPGIFQRLEPDLRGKVVLDAGAGSGRASF